MGLRGLLVARNTGTTRCSLVEGDRRRPQAVRDIIAGSMMNGGFTVVSSSLFYEAALVEESISAGAVVMFIAA